MRVDLVRAELVTGLTGGLWRVSSSWSSIIPLPGLVVGLPTVRHPRDFGGKSMLTVELHAVVERNDDAQAVEALDRAISTEGEQSVFALLRAIPTPVSWRKMSCLETGPYGAVTIGKAQCLAVSFLLEIECPRNTPTETENS